jgi:hypothetical protein
MYFAGGWYPYEFDPPLITDNHADLEPNSGLTIPAMGIAVSPDSRHIIDAALTGECVAIRLELKAQTIRQVGPARIFTISQNPYAANLTIAQSGADLIIRVLRPGSTDVGTPAFRVKRVVDATRFLALKLVVGSHRIKVQVNDNVALNEYLPDNTFSRWKNDYQLALGNELTLDRPWFGIITQAHIKAGDVSIDLLQPGKLEVPKSLWLIPERLRPILAGDALPYAPLDWTINLLGFLPLGWLFVNIWRGAHPLFSVILLAAGVSLGIEVGQIFIATRYPTPIDVMLNIAGSVIGAALALRCAATPESV